MYMAKKKSTRKSAKPQKTTSHKSSTKKSATKKAAVRKPAPKRAAPKKKTAKKGARLLWRPVCSKHGRLSEECMARAQALQIATTHALSDPQCQGDAEKC